MSSERLRKTNMQSPTTLEIILLILAILTVHVIITHLIKGGFKTLWFMLLSPLKGFKSFKKSYNKALSNKIKKTERVLAQNVLIERTIKDSAVQTNPKLKHLKSKQDYKIYKKNNKLEGRK